MIEFRVRDIQLEDDLVSVGVHLIEHFPVRSLRGGRALVEDGLVGRHDVLRPEGGPVGEGDSVLDWNGPRFVAIARLGGAGG